MIITRMCNFVILGFKLQNLVDSRLAFKFGGCVNNKIIKLLKFLIVLDFPNFIETLEK